MCNDIMQNPLVSVCIPTFNRSQKLKRAVDKLLESNYENLEILISDNASPDDTQEVCLDLVKQDGRIKYFRHSKNHGMAFNFEFVRERASGKYFLWHGDDDYLQNNYIRSCVDELERNQSFVLVSGLAVYNRDNGEFCRYGNIIQNDSFNPIMRMVKYLLNVSDNSIFCGLYRSSSVEDLEIPNFPAGDWAWVACILWRGRAKVVPNLFIHREFEKSTSISLASNFEAVGFKGWLEYIPKLAVKFYCFLYIIKSNKAKRGFIHLVFSFFIVFLALIFKGLVTRAYQAALKCCYVKKIYFRLRGRSI